MHSIAVMKETWLDVDENVQFLFVQIFWLSISGFEIIV